jgi:hypothetical protein
MTESTKQQDLNEFFGFVQSPDRTPDRLIRAYIAFHGDINWSQQNVFVETLRASLGPAAARLGRDDVLGASGEINRHFLETHLPELADAYFVPEQPQGLNGVTILPDSRNEWQDTSLPHPLNLRLKVARRAAFSILRADCRTLFAGPYGYQGYDAQRGRYWPLLSSRAFGRSVDHYPRMSIQCPLVIIQDQFDGGNFAHFLGDWVPRILYFAMYFPAEAARSMFLLGGHPGPLQRLTLRLISAATGILENQFLYPQERAVLELASPPYFFSDQRAAYLHPLHMGHPATVRMTRDLFSRLRLDSDGPPRLYISRRDAINRKIVNETELCQALAKRGFTEVSMSDYDVMRQISMINTARTIVAPHGMGLTWLLLHRGLASVLELFHPTIGTDSYAFISKAVGMHYRFLLGADANDGNAGYSVEVQRVTDQFIEI